MQTITKLKNKSLPHSLLLKPRVGTVVNVGGIYYYNTAGKNGPITDANLWFKIFSESSGGGGVTLDKTAADVTGTDPDFKIDLSADGLPEFPVSFTVYVDVVGDVDNPNYILLDPASYNPTTKILAGLSSPDDFPNQKIKIIYQ